MKKFKKDLIQASEYKEQHPTESLTSVAKIFGIDRHSLSDFIKKDININQLYSNHADETDEYLYYFTNEEIEYTKYYIEHSDEPYDRIREKFLGYPDIRAIRRWADILGYSYHVGIHYKYIFNRDKFKDINTEEDAYWLGFITADGCIIRDNTLQIKLAEKDRGHLIKFAKYMGLDDEQTKEILKDGVGGAYTRDNPIVTIKICSVDVVNNSKDKNIFPRKSGREIPYVCKSTELEKAYIRGLIDGDGCLSNGEQDRISLVGSEAICQYVLNFINNNIQQTKTHVLTKDTIYTIIFNGKFLTRKIANFIYGNSSIYLDRKYKIYKKRYSELE